MKFKDVRLNNRNNKIRFNKAEDNVAIGLAKQTRTIVVLYSYNDVLSEIAETMKVQQLCWEKKIRAR